MNFIVFWRSEFCIFRRPSSRSCWLRLMQIIKYLHVNSEKSLLVFFLHSTESLFDDIRFGRRWRSFINLNSLFINYYLKIIKLNISGRQIQLYRIILNEKLAFASSKGFTPTLCNFQEHSPPLRHLVTFL